MTQTTEKKQLQRQAQTYIKRVTKLDDELRDMGAALGRYNAQYKYVPSPKQLEFHEAGANFRERMLFGGNRTGKTMAGAEEGRYHLTGEYPEPGDVGFPDGWQGLRFKKPTVVWAAGVSSEMTREVCQRYLCGEPSEMPKSLGSGLIPREQIISHKMARGVSNLIDTLVVRHKSGGSSKLRFKSFEQGRKKFQSDAVNFVWLDEECPLDIYTECLTRTNDGGQGVPGATGSIAVTFTPLEGLTAMVHRFYPTPTIEQAWMVQMSLDDVTHFDDEQKQKIIASYPEHEARARIDGLPVLGSGLVFPVRREDYEVEDFRVPAEWRQIIGIDPGNDHPFGRARCVVDTSVRERHIFYVVEASKASRQPDAVHMEVLRSMGAGKSGRNIPVAWPHDLNQFDRNSGEQYVEGFRKSGLNMLHEHATHPTGGIGIEAAIAEVLRAMEEGRFKVFMSCFDWWSEVMGYHRKDGKLVKERDDVISAVLKCWMMQRYARELVSVQVMQASYIPENYDPMETDYAQGGLDW